MKVFSEESRQLIGKIMECRIAYLTAFGLDPNYVVIPWGSIYLLDCHPFYRPGYDYDTWHGMIIIESRACRNTNEVKVY